MKNNHGITIVELVIVMIIMILIVSFAVYSGIELTKKAEATELYEEMNSLKNAIISVKVRKELEEQDDDWYENFYDEKSGDMYVIYGIGDEGYEYSKVRENLNLKAIRRRYIVNFEDESVMLAYPVEVLGSSVRTYDAVRNLVETK